MPAPVVVGVDPLEPQEGRDALALAGLLAAALGSPVHAVHVFAPADGDIVQQRRHHEHEMLSLLGAAGIAGTVTAFAGTSAAFVLHHLADRERAACVVIGSGHTGLTGRTSLGPVAQALLHGSMVPIVVAPRGYVPRSRSLSRIGVACGGTPESDEALRQARELAEPAGAQLSVLAAEDPTPVAGATDPRERLERALALAGDDAIGVIAEGDAAGGLAAAASDLDLLVAGSRSYGPLRVVLLGAVTRRLLEMAPCPVMVVPRLPDAAHAGALVGGMAVALGA